MAGLVVTQLHRRVLNPRAELAVFQRCAAPRAGATWQQCRCGSSTNGRDFWQRLDQQHLAQELKNLSRAGHLPREGDRAGASGDRAEVRERPSRRLAASVEDLPNGNSAQTREGGASEYQASRRPGKPWLDYESLRGETYPLERGGKKQSDGGSSASSIAPKGSMTKGGPKFQDLTHNEAQRMQEMYMRKRMLDKKILWMKMQDEPNPQKDAKMQMRAKENEEKARQAAAEGAGGQLYPPPFVENDRQDRKLQAMEDEGRLEELESRFRNRIRQEKLESSKLARTPAPTIGDLITDPKERHVDRRLVRQRVKIQRGLEEILTNNTAQILYEFLRGVSVSIVKVKAKSPRATQDIVYQLTSDHDPEWVRAQLNILAPKLRSQFALKVNMGQTPAIRFVPYVAPQEVRREYLWEFARRIQRETPVGGHGFDRATRAAVFAADEPGRVKVPVRS